MRNYSLRKDEEKNGQQGNEILHEKEVNDHDESFVEDLSEDNNSLDSLLDDDSINYY